MSWLDRFKSRGRSDLLDGSSLDTAIRVSAVGTAEGIAAEYAILEARLGKQDRDWHLHDRIIVRCDDGRVVERFIVSHRGARKEIHFDVSSWFGKEISPDSKPIIDRAIARAEAVQVCIDLPMDAVTTLSVILVGVDSGPMKEFLDTRPIVEAINRAFEAEDEDAQRSGFKQLTLSRATWIKVLAVLRSVRPQDLLDEECLEDLKAYIDGGLKAERTNRL